MKKLNIRTVLILIIAGLCVVTAAAVLGINAYVRCTQRRNIISVKDAEAVKADCIIVLGCQVKENGNPSNMLSDRLQRGVGLYKCGAAPKLIMSGDHGRREYDEVNVMKNYAVENDVPSEDVFMDHAGFSTYESMYRAKEIFKAEKVVIVTQKYHLYRALYIAGKLGLEAYGVSSDYRTYPGQLNREVREILARCKDFVKAAIKPEPTFLGEAIPVSGDGDRTND